MREHYPLFSNILRFQLSSTLKLAFIALKSPMSNSVGFYIQFDLRMMKAKFLPLTFYRTFKIDLKGLALWCSALSYCLQHWRLISDHRFKFWLLHFHSSSLLLHLGRQWEMSQIFVFFPPTWEIGLEFQVPGFHLAQPYNYNHCGVDSRSLFP